MLYLAPSLSSVGYPPLSQRPTLAPMHYVYLIQSQPRPTHRYIGITSDLKRRLSDHNRGKQSHTAPFAPWRLIAYTAFSAPTRAHAFERYLKSGSGHAFARTHLW